MYINNRLTVGAFLFVVILPGLVFSSVVPELASQTSYRQLTNNLSLGSKGLEVTMMQDLLRSRGYLNTSPTGYFGSLTKSAVIKYQSDNGITPTGFVGPMTRGAMNKSFIFIQKPSINNIDANNKNSSDNTLNTDAQSIDSLYTSYKKGLLSPEQKAGFLKLVESTTESKGTELVLKLLKSSDDKELFNTAIKNILNNSLDNDRLKNTSYSRSDITKVVIKTLSIQLEEYASRDKEFQRLIKNSSSQNESEQRIATYNQFLRDKSNFRVLGLMDVLVPIIVGSDNIVPDKATLIRIASGDELDIGPLGRRVAMYVLAKRHNSDKGTIELFSKLSKSSDPKISEYSKNIYKNPVIKNYTDFVVGL
jgi:peptidoglycan hydrolase-like protein with peptidoglycan-binding domain